MSILLASLLFVQDAEAADPCKHVATHVSAFGDRRRGGVAQRLNGKSAVGVGMTSDDTKVSLKVEVNERGALRSTVEAGSTVPARMSDGTTLQLVTAGDAVTTSLVSTAAQVVTIVTYTFDLTPEQLASFVNTDLVALRLPLLAQGGSFDWEAQTKAQQKLRDLATCLSR